MDGACPIALALRGVTALRIGVTVHVHSSHHRLITHSTHNYFSLSLYWLLRKTLHAVPHFKCFSIFFILLFSSRVCGETALVRFDLICFRIKVTNRRSSTHAMIKPQPGMFLVWTFCWLDKNERGLENGREESVVQPVTRIS